jgi:serine protease Do
VLPVILVGAFLLTASVDAQAQSFGENNQQRRQLFTEIAPAVIFISNGSGEIGSGFFVTSDGLALTNRHVVKGADEVQIVLRNGEKTTGKVVARTEDREIDLALVDVSVEEVDPLELASLETLHVGDWAGAIGHGMGGVWTFTTGIISNIYSPGSNETIFQTQIPVNPGASGAPVFTHEGKVVGVIFAGINESNNINFAVPSDESFEVFERLEHLCDGLIIEAPEDTVVYLDGSPVGRGPRIVTYPADGKHQIHTVHKGKMLRKSVNFPSDKTVELKPKKGSN